MNNTSKTAQSRKFGYTVGSAFAALWLLHLVLNYKYSWWALIIGLTLCLLALLKPAWLTPVNLFWIRLATGMGIVNTYVLLVIFYYFIMTPISLVRRIVNKNSLHLKRAKLVSYWQKATPNATNRMEDQF